MKCASGRLPLAWREHFYQMRDSKAVLLSPFCGLVLHISVSAFHELREKKQFSAATNFSDTGSKTMTSVESCPCVLEEILSVKNASAMFPQGSLTGKCWWWKNLYSVADISLSSKNLRFDISQLWMSQVTLGQKRRLPNFLYSLVDYWNR